MMWMIFSAGNSGVKYSSIVSGGEAIVAGMPGHSRGRVAQTRRCMNGFTAKIRLRGRIPASSSNWRVKRMFSAVLVARLSSRMWARGTPHRCGHVGEHLRLGLLPRRRQQIVLMRHAARQNQHRSETAVIELCREFGHPQVVGAQRDDRVRRDRLLRHQVVIPDDAGQPQHFFVHSAASRSLSRLVSGCAGP